MDTGQGVTILVSVVAYMGICVVVGLWALRRTRSSADFFMAGRNLGVIVTGFAVFSSIMSGFGFVGGPGLVYHMGMSSLWLVLISAPMGTCISFYLLGKRIRLLAELKESVSLPDVVAARYNSQLTRLLASLSILLGVMGYLGDPDSGHGYRPAGHHRQHSNRPVESGSLCGRIFCSPGFLLRHRRHYRLGLHGRGSGLHYGDCCPVGVPGRQHGRSRWLCRHVSDHWGR